MAVDTRDPDSAAPVHARATVRPDKAAAVAELAEAFRSSSAAVLTEYRGLTVKQVTALRVALGEGTTYSIVKNTLTRLAAADAGLEGLDALLAGPTAVAFISGEPVEAAKALRDYARTNPALVVKGGVLDGRPMTAEQIRTLADLESREVLLAKMAGALKASLTGAVQLFAAPLAQTARLAEALRAKAEEDPSVLRGGAGSATTPASQPAMGAPADAEPATGQSGDTATGTQEPARVTEDASVVRDAEPIDTTPATQPAMGAPADAEPATGQSGDTTPAA